MKYELSENEYLETLALVRHIFDASMRVMETEKAPKVRRGWSEDPPDDWGSWPDEKTESDAPETEFETKFEQETEVTPEVKADLTARQEFQMMGTDAYWQIAMVHQSSAPQDLRTAENAIIGELPAYTSFNLSAGFEFPWFSLDFFIRNATDERGELYRYTECAIATCTQYYVVPIQPRTFAMRVSRTF